MTEITLIDFLKKYSTVNNQFIDDFYGLYDIKNPDKFNVNLNTLATWLKCKKYNLKETLNLSYTKNIDYILVKNSNKKTSKKQSNPVGKPNQIIMLTPDTVKLLCMRSKAEKADQVRNYYLQLEKLIDKYKDHIISSMDEKIQALKNNQKPKVNTKKGVLYIIKASDDETLYKIGRTKDLKNRLNGYNSGKADSIAPILIYEANDIITVENCVKALLKKYQYRKYKEVYEADVDLIKESIKQCDELNSCLTLIKKNKTKITDEKYFISIHKD